MSYLIETLLGLAIGLALGLLGGGGSILTVPALVYIIGQSPQTAVSASLIIVGANSAMGALFHRAQGTLNWRVALIFGGTGMVTAYLAAGLSDLFSASTLMILFALLMLVVGAYMILRKSPAQLANPAGNLGITMLSGAGVGLLTGFLGVGGGFLIVPALVMLVGLPMKQAVGTSLVIIAMNSLAGFAGHIGTASLDYLVVSVFAVAGIVGAFAGARLAKHIHAERLRQLFAFFVIILALILLYDNVGRLVYSRMQVIADLLVQFFL